MRVPPGHEGHYAEAAWTYKAIAARAMPSAHWRVSQVTAGVPGPTSAIFSSLDSFDTMLSEGMAACKTWTAEERATFQKSSTEALVNADSNRYRLHANMSYVSAEAKAAFWSKK